MSDVTNFSETTGNSGTIRDEYPISIADLNGADYVNDKGFMLTNAGADGDVQYELINGNGKTLTNTLKAGETLNTGGVRKNVRRVVNAAATTITAFLVSHL